MIRILTAGDFVPRKTVADKFDNGLFEGVLIYFLKSGVNDKNDARINIIA